MNKNSSLTPKQQRFCDEYLISLNATQAAITAGYSLKTARHMGYENLTKPYIQSYLKTRIKQAEKRTEITMDKVLQFWADIAFTPMDELFDSGPDGTLIPKSFDEMTDRAKRCVSELKAQFDMDGAGWQTIKRIDQLKASEMIAKHLGMFIERKEIGTPGEFDKLTDAELDARIRKEAEFFQSYVGKAGEEGRQREKQSDRPH
jgi:phage terminase small subunit